MAKNKMHTSHSSSQYVNDEWGCWKWCQYALFTALSIVLLLGAAAIAIFWAVTYRSPLSFDWKKEPNKAFNLHPVMMIVGFITLSGLSTLTFRMCRCFKRLWCKLLHTVLHSLAIACVVVGFLITFEHARNLQRHHFYSMHSWLGLVTLGLFGLQFVFGFFTFLLLACCPSSTACFRARMVPVHSAMGLATFFLAVATCLTGLMQEFNKIDSNTTESPTGKESSMPEQIYFFKTEHFLLNLLAAVLCALVLLLAFVLRGPPRADSDALPCGPPWGQGVKGSASRATIGTY